MRQRLFSIIEPGDSTSKWSNAYDLLMIVTIAASILPLAWKNPPAVFSVIDKVAAALFICDYMLRWITADYKLGKHAPWSFVRYPFTLMAIIDFVSILPSMDVIGRGFRLLRLVRIFRAMRVFRVFKALRYSRNLQLLLRVLRKSKRSFISVASLAAGYIIISALVIFSVEPDTFDTFFDAIYWATVSLTTVGYGDIYPVTVIGKLVSMISSILGIAIVALPAGIVTAGYMTELTDGEQ